MGQYLPIICLMILAILFGAISFGRVAAVGAAPSVGGEGSPVRVRHPAQP